MLWPRFSTQSFESAQVDTCVTQNVGSNQRKRLIKNTQTLTLITQLLQPNNMSTTVNEQCEMFGLLLLLIINFIPDVTLCKVSYEAGNISMQRERKAHMKHDPWSACQLSKHTQAYSIHIGIAG